jgi:hypothetical protein
MSTKEILVVFILFKIGFFIPKFLINKIQKPGKLFKNKKLW